MPSLPPHFFLFEAAFFMQIPAVLLFVAYAWAPHRVLNFSATACLTGSFFLHLLFTGALAYSGGRLPLASGFEFLSGWGLILTALVVWLEWEHRLGLLGTFLAPLSAALLLMGFRFVKAASDPVPGLDDAWLLSHVALAMVAYSCFTAAAGVAGAYLVQERQLKAKRLGTLFYQLPPLQALEELLARLALAGLTALLAALVAGFVWKQHLYGQWGLDDPKVVFNLGVGAVFAVGLWFRRSGALRGRRFAVLCVLTFLAVFFGFYLVNIYFGGHGFLRPATGA